MTVKINLGVAIAVYLSAHAHASPVGESGCTSSMFASSQSDSFVYTELASNDETCTICTSGKYDLYATDSSIQNGLLKVIVDSSVAINCSSSMAFATNTVTSIVYSTVLKNQGDMTCVADWYGVFHTQTDYAQNSFNVSFAFADLLTTTDDTAVLTPSYSSRLGSQTSVQSMTEPQFIINSISSQAVNSTSTEYETTVQLSLGAETQGCAFPSTINLVLGNGLGPTCRPSAVAMTSTPGQYKWLHTYEPEDITGCGADTSNTLYFQLPMSMEISYSNNWASGAYPTDRAWCFGEETVTGARSSQCFGNAAYVRPTIAPSQFSNIFINKLFVSDSTANMKRVALSMVSYGATPCTGEIFSPQGTPYMMIKATGLTSGDVSSLTWSATDQVLQNANIVSLSDCGDMNDATTCVTFTQVGCQAMNNFGSGTCAFANDDKVLTVTATNAAGSTTTVLNPKTASLPNSFTTCSVPKTTQNVTGQYTVNFSAVREDGSTGISLYRPIISTIEITNLSPSGSLSFYITDVTVQLRAQGALLASRTFTRTEKQRLMMSLSSPYYADAHYCRSMSQTTCSSFYSLFSNPLTTASPSTYNVGGGHKSCPSGAMNLDRFMFTPSDWGMDRYASSNLALEMRFVITAMMTPCGSSGRRLSSVPQVTYIDVSKRVTRDTCQQSNIKACSRVKNCMWTTNPTINPLVSTCVAKSTVSNWGCENIRSTAGCSLNKSCKFNKIAKKCSIISKKGI